MNFKALIQLAEASVIKPTKYDTIHMPPNDPGFKFGKYVFGKQTTEFHKLKPGLDIKEGLTKPTYTRVMGLSNLAGAKWHTLYKYYNFYGIGSTKVPLNRASTIILGTLSKDLRGNPVSTPIEVAYHRLELSDPQSGTSKIYTHTENIPVGDYEKVLNGEFDPAAILQRGNELEIFDYIKKILKNKRWPEAEPYIIKNPVYAYNYANNVLKTRWRAAEPIIQQNQQLWNQYQDHFAEEFIDDL